MVKGMAKSHFPFSSEALQSKFVNSHLTVREAFVAHWEDVYTGVAFNKNDSTHLMFYAGFVAGYACHRDRTLYDSGMLHADAKLGIAEDDPTNHVNCMTRNFNREGSELASMLLEIAGIALEQERADNENADESNN